MKRLITGLWIAMMILMPIKRLCADDSTELTLSIDGADGQIDDNTYYVIQPTEDGDTTTVTITGDGDDLTADDSGIVCITCDDDVDEGEENGDPTWVFDNDAGDQDGDTITWNIDNGTDTGSYTFSLDSVMQDFECPSGDEEIGDDTAEDFDLTPEMGHIKTEVRKVLVG